MIELVKVACELGKEKRAGDEVHRLPCLSLEAERASISGWNNVWSNAKCRYNLDAARSVMLMFSR